jgi:hypothetical protein
LGPSFPRSASAWSQQPFDHPAERVQTEGFLQDQRRWLQGPSIESSTCPVTKTTAGITERQR